MLSARQTGVRSWPCVVAGEVTLNAVVEGTVWPTEEFFLSLIGSIGKPEDFEFE